MARPLALLSRLGALSGSPAAPLKGCRFASRGASKVWMGQTNRAPGCSREMSEEEPDLQDVEDKLQALVDEERKKQRTVKYHMLRRQMTPSGAPQRKLTWDAIEQIRYLKQEQPDEWTVERLAEGFSVTPDAILRVLRSKFVPAPERKAKQDGKVVAEIRQQVLPSGARTEQDRLKLPGKGTAAVLTPGGRAGAVAPVAERALMLRGGGSGSLAKSPVPVTVGPDVPSAGAPETGSTDEDGTTNMNLTEVDSKEEESWDGQVLTDEELEACMEMEKPSPVVQVGKDFLDVDGNFLYRI